MADLLVERPRDGVALVRINRPEARNALNRAALTPLAMNHTTRPVAGWTKP